MMVCLPQVNICTSRSGTELQYVGGARGILCQPTKYQLCSLHSLRRLIGFFGRPFLTTLCLRPVWLAKAHPLVPPGDALIWAVLKRVQLYGLQHIGSFTGSCITFPRFCQSLTCFIDASFTASELPDTPKAGHHRPAFSFCGDDAQVVEPCSSGSTLSVTSTGIRLLFLLLPAFNISSSA